LITCYGNQKTLERFGSQGCSLAAIYALREIKKPPLYGQKPRVKMGSPKEAKKFLVFVFYNAVLLTTEKATLQRVAKSCFCLNFKIFLDV